MSKIKVEVLGKKAPRPNRRAQKVSKRITTAQSERNLTRKVVSFVWFVVKPRRPTWALGALAFVLASFGTPQDRAATSAVMAGSRVCGATWGQTGIVLRSP